MAEYDPAKMSSPSPPAEPPVDPAPPVTPVEPPPSDPAPETPPEPAAPAAPAGEKRVTDPSRIFGQKQPEPAAEESTGDEEIEIPPDTPTKKEPPHVRKLAKALDDKKRAVKSLESQVSNLNTELAELRKQPRTAENAAEIAALTAEREEAKAAKAEAEQLRNELAETRKNLAVTDVRSSTNFLKEQTKLSDSVARARTVLDMVQKEYGVDVKINALVREWRSDDVDRPLYNSIISSLRDAGNPAAEELLKAQLKAIVRSQNQMYDIEQSGLKEKEAWETNRKGAFTQTIEATRKDLASKYPIYDRSSQMWMALPQESKDAISGLEAKAAEAAEIAVNTKDPAKLASMAYQAQLALEIANAGHANATTQLERMNATVAERDAELAALKTKLASYERAVNGSAGGLGRSTPTTGTTPPKLITDPFRMKLTF